MGLAALALVSCKDNDTDPDNGGGTTIWNITNVTRSDRHYLYTTKAMGKGYE